MKTGLHTRMTGTVGDLYLTLAEEVMGARIGKFPSGDKKLERDRLRAHWDSAILSVQS